MVSIRYIKPDDIKCIAEIENMVFKSPWTKEMIESELSHDFSHFFVAEENKKPVGYGCFWIVADESHITNLAVHPEFQGKGFGKLLLKRLVEASLELGSKKIFLEVRRSNSVAQNLYESLGFEKISIRKNYYQKEKEDAIIMMLDTSKR